MSLNKLSEEIHADNIKKGFYDTEPNPLAIHMLIVSEIAEATESVRRGNPAYYEHESKPEGEAAELVDALIRILDYAAYKDWDVDYLVQRKLAYNRTRPYKHGKKL